MDLGGDGYAASPRPLSKPRLFSYQERRSNAAQSSTYLKNTDARDDTAHTRVCGT